MAPAHEAILGSGAPRSRIGGTLPARRRSTLLGALKFRYFPALADSTSILVAFVAGPEGRERGMFALSRGAVRPVLQSVPCSSRRHSPAREIASKGLTVRFLGHGFLRQTFIGFWVVPRRTPPAFPTGRRSPPTVPGLQGRHRRSVTCDALKSGHVLSYPSPMADWGPSDVSRIRPAPTGAKSGIGRAAHRVVARWFSQSPETEVANLESRE
jgi:hypothetical protein